MNIIDHWLRKVAEFDILFKSVYLSVVTGITILIDLIFADLETGFPVEYISYSFFFLLFLIWIYRIMLSDLRADKDKEVTKKEKACFFVITFLDVFILNLWFLHSVFSFQFLLVAIFSCSFLLWLVFLLLDRYILENSEIRIYFRLLSIVIFINITILFAFNLIRS
jgi:hypothetical protein